MKKNNLLLLIILLGVLTLFFFPNPESNFLAYAGTALFFVILTTSSLLGILFKNAFDIEGLFFFYKYFLLFYIPVIVNSANIDAYRHKYLMKILFYSYIALSAWVYVYGYLVYTGAIVGSLRVSFPFSTDYYLSDAHLYSSYLGIFFLATMFYWHRFFNFPILVTIFMSIFLLGAIILTGSRTGVSILLIGFSSIVWSVFDKDGLSLHDRFSESRIVSMKK